MIGIKIDEFYWILFVCLALLLFFSKNKLPRFIFLLLISLLSNSYVDLADYEGYSQMYNAPNGNVSGQIYLDETDVGYRILVYIGNYFNIDFFFFKTILYFFFSILFVKSLDKLNPISVNFVLALYIFYPLILDLVQIRHFLAMSSFMFAFSFFFESLKKGKVHFSNILLFIPSTLFHASFIFLVMIVLFTYILNKKIYRKHFLLKNVILFFICYLTISCMIFVINFTKIDYLKTYTSLFTNLFYSTLFLIYFFILYLIRKKASINSNNDLKSLDFIFLLTTLLAGSSLPLLLYNVEFFRFFRVELFIILSSSFSILINEKSYSSSVLIVTLFFIHITAAVVIYNASYIESVLLPLLLMGENVII